MHLVLLGGGHVHALALLAWIARPLQGVRLTLVNRDRFAPYSGMLPGLVAGHYRFDDIHIDLEKLAKRAGAQFLADEIIALDATNQYVETRSSRLSFDIASIDLGSVPDTRMIAGNCANDLSPKPLAPFLANLTERDARTGLTPTIIGGGPAGVELALSLARRLIGKAADIRLVTDGFDILLNLPKRARSLARQSLEGHGIRLLTQAPVLARSPDGILLADGRHILASDVVWVNGAAPALDLSTSGLSLDERGFVRVMPTMQTLGHECIFASGDMASFDPPLPKAGVHAVRQGPVLAENIRSFVLGKALSAHHPSRDMLILLSTADGRAIGTRNGITLAGRFVWQLKDRIDRGFMARFA